MKVFNEKSLHGVRLLISFSVLLFLFGLPESGYSQVFNKHYIERNFQGIHKIKVFDLDQDGDLDIIGGSEHTPYATSRGIAWWRNEGGYPIKWSKFQISTTFLHVMSVDVGCIDNDTFPDIITSSWENGKISWFKNSGDPTAYWREQIVVSGWTNPHDAVLSDLNKDGKTEIIGVSAGNNRISIFYNQSDSLPVWDEHVLVNNFISAKSVSVADLNNDTYLDIIGCADVADDIIWWNNNGGSWNASYVTNNFDGSDYTCVIDMNYDGQLDIIGTGWEGNTIAIWICENIQTNSWRKTLVTNNLSIATIGIGNDIDRDGDMDIIAISKIPGKLVIYYNDSFSFTETELNPHLNGAAALQVIDIDKDGDDDIIVGAGVSGDLLLYENATITGVPEMVNNEMSLKTYPNPFSNFTTIQYQVGDHSQVSIKIFDLNGKEVKTLINNYESSGTKTQVWDGTNNTGQRVPCGVYCCSIYMDDQIKSLKMWALWN